MVYREISGVRTYLVIRGINGEYGFPKGHVEGNETEYKTAIRELKEETNIEVDIIDGFRRQIEYPLPRRKDVIKRTVYFLGRYSSGELTYQKSELSDAEFMPLDAALRALTFEQTKRILLDADLLIKSLEKTANL